MNKILLASAAAVVFAAVPAHATTTLYTDVVTFEGKLGTSVVDDYQDPGYVFSQNDATMSGVIGETRYETTGFPDNNLVPTITGTTEQYYCAGCNGSFNLYFDATSVTTGNGVFGVGFDFFNTNANVNFDALVTFGDGSTELYDLDIIGFPNFQFFGITSDDLISSIAFGPDGGTTQAGSFGIDNLTIGDMGAMGAVPEPATWAFMIFGFGAIGGALRRGRKAHVKVSYA